MSQQIIIPASTNQTKLELLENGSPITSPITFAPGSSNRTVDIIVTELTTTTTTTTLAPTTTTTTTVPPTTTTTTTLAPSTTTTTTKASGGDVTLFGNNSVSLPRLNDGEPLEVGVKFQSSKAGIVKGVRFFKISGTTGIHTANLWNSAGTKLATGQFTETASGWQQVLFSSPVSIAANTIYTASIFSASGDYISKLSGLATATISSSLSTVVGSNGVFKYTTSGFPTATYQNSNYYIDVVFSVDVSTTTTTTSQGQSTTTTTTKASSTTTSTTSVAPPLGAQGFGANAGGGSTVVNVATKAQFDAALGSNKYIKFTADVTFTDRVDITYNNLTIDGNGFDVTINNGNNGDGISFNGPNAHHCILRGIRVINSGGDGINVIDGSHDILIDHCSSYDNRDGNIDIAGDNVGITKNVTVQWCFIGRGAASNSSYSGCSLITGQSVSFHHNLFAPATLGGVGERCPLIHCNYSPVGNPNADVRYNLVWRYGRDNGSGSGFGIDSAYGAATNAVGNYVYTTGGDTGNGVTTSAYGEPSGLLYANGNVSGNNVNADAASNHNEYLIPTYAQIPSETACAAARRVLQSAGLPTKSAYEQSIFSTVTLPNC